MRRQITRPVFLDTAVKAARAGGRALLRFFAKDFRVYFKGEVNLVTEADHEAEAVILRTIRRAFPDHSFLAEESGEQLAPHFSKAQYKWIIDPLDGTTNFAHSFPVYCVSVALEVRGEVIVGVVYDPVRRELFAAEKGCGASLNGVSINVSQTKKIDQSLLVTGFAYNRKALKNNLGHFSNFSLRAQGVRRTGSAALDLCYVACSRFDGFWEMKLSPWDTAAGFLIATEAGATATDFSNRPFHIYLKEIVASNGCIHREMLEVLAMSNNPGW
jgi:myo-inositol-1(or 4)-monophosphatase